MSPLVIKVLLAGWFIIVLAFIGVTIYYTVQIKRLSLPISQIYAYSALALPIVTGLVTLLASRVRSKLSLLTVDQQTLLFLAITILQSIYEAIIATLAVKYMSPNCSLEEQWKALYIRKDGGAIRRIQDRFECCGFNTVVDRAWPFPHGKPEDGLGADQCRKMFGRETACGEAWRGAQLRISWGFFCLAGSIFIFRVSGIQNSQSTGWVQFFGQVGDGRVHENGFDNSAANRGLIDQGESAVEQERYRDDSIDGVQTGNSSTDYQSSSRPRVEPSGLAADNSDGQWNDN